MSQHKQSARDAILARLRQAPRDASTEPDATNRAADPSRHSASATGSSEALKQTCIEQMLQNQIEVWPCQKGEWPEQLKAICQKKNLNQWLLGTGRTGEAALNTLNNLPKLSARQFDEDYQALKDELYEHIQVGFTEARCAIADTGTLVLIPSKEEPRTLSLIPPVHVVLLKSAHIVASFQTLTENPPWNPDSMPGNLLFISSPSKTADIQQTLAYGAHGPKEVIVILED